MGVAVTGLDMAGRVTYFNPAAEALYGWSAEEVLGRRIFEVFPLGKVRLSEDVILRQFESRRPWTLEMTLGHRDGTTFPGLVMGQTLLDGSGKPVGSVAISMDITRLKAAEEAVALSERRFRALVEHADDLVVVIDPELQVKYLSPSAARQFGYGEDGSDPDATEIWGLEYIHPSDVERMLQILEQAFAQPRTVLRAALRVRHGDGSYRWLEGTVINLIDEPGVEGLLVNLHDVTERQRADARYRKLVDSSPTGVLVVSEGLVRFTNPAAVRMLRAEDPAVLVGREVRSLLHPDDAEAVAEALEVEGARAAGRRGLEARFVRADGEVVHALARFMPLDWGDVEATQVLVEDITAQKLAEEQRLASVGALARRERFYREILDSMAQETAVLDTEGKVVSVNAAWRRLGQESGGTLARCAEGENYVEVCEASTEVGSCSVLAQGIRTVLAGERAELRMDVSAPTPVGERWFMVGVVPLTSGEAGAVVTLLEITARKSFESELSHQATHDYMTGLPNRVLLLDRLAHAIDRARRRPVSLAVLFLDLNEFKLVNDSFGHSAGDEVLVAVARRLEEALRPGDTIARFAGDEFVVVCEDLDTGDEEGGAVIRATAVAERLLGAVSSSFSVEGTEVELGASIGIALLSDEVSSAEALLQDADAAMFEAKTQGRSRWVLSDGDSRGKVRARLESTQFLRRALRNEELELHFQPLVELNTLTPVGVEALVRWRHPQKGLVLPGQFISLAEQSGLIVQLGDWVLEAACYEASRWTGPLAGLGVSVNLSARQLADPDLASTVRSVLFVTGLDPSRLCLEITESAIMESPAEAAEILKVLSSLGLTLAIDDFGTGYSSLAYLKDFAVHLLKIDRSFVAGLEANPGNRKIVEAVVGLADAFGLPVVAEGVETPSELTEARRLGCRIAQGFYFSAAMPAGELRGWVSRGRLTGRGAVSA